MLPTKSSALLGQHTYVSFQLSVSVIGLFTIDRYVVFYLICVLDQTAASEVRTNLNLYLRI